VGASLAEDSARFAANWSLLESGDSATARDYLIGLGDSLSDRTGQMTNFLLAARAFRATDWAGVPVFLDLGVPLELSDYALYLRSRALQEAGQRDLARSFWARLADDTASVLAPEALYETAIRADEAGEVDSLVARTLRHDQRRSSGENAQVLHLRVARALASMGRLTEAVDALWSGYLLAPGSDRADELMGELAKFARVLGARPRLLTADEIACELEALDQAGRYEQGLRRALAHLQSPMGVVCTEMLDFYRGRFQSGLGRHRDAVTTLSAYLKSYPTSTRRAEALFHLGRSAYLRDQDSLAVASLSEAAVRSTDSAVSRRALDLLAVLHLDRGRPRDATRACRFAEPLSRGTDDEAMSLWRLGWALYLADSAREAAAVWERLAARDSLSDYTPLALYWSGRALDSAGQSGAAQRAELAIRFPYSYYSILSGVCPDSSEIIRSDLVVPSLDTLFNTGGAHTRKWALLAAMRLPDLALREWGAAAGEIASNAGFHWWRARLHLWAGDERSAWLVVLTKLGAYLRRAGTRPPEFWTLAYPLDFDPIIVDLARARGLDPYLVFALICQESHFDPRAVSPVGATGLMQLMPGTARAEARRLGLSYSASRLRDPDYNLRLGISHLDSLFSDFRGDTVLVLAAYNAGPSAAQAWYEEFGDRPRDEFVELIPYRETRLFIKRVFEHRAAYRRLYPDVVPQSAASSPQDH